MIYDLPKAVRGAPRLVLKAATVAEPAQASLFNYQPFACSTFSDEEVYRMTGSLPDDRIERLIDASSDLHKIADVDGHVSEAMGQYPAEDFLCDVMEYLNKLASKLRGANKESLTHIIGGMEDQLQTQFYATEYGRNELQKALNVLDGAGVTHESRKTKAKAKA